MSLNPRKHPTLPQNDTNRPSRERQLREAQRRYVWTQSVATLPGVPLAEKVHLSDEPSIPWLIAVGEVALVVVENQIAVAEARREGASPDHRARLDELRERFNGLQSSHTEHLETFQSASREGRPGFLSEALGVARTGQRTHALRSLLNELHELFYNAHPDSGVPFDALSAYNDLFQTIPLPQLATDFMDDDVFARLRVAGPNPMLLRRVSSLPIKFPVTDAQYQHVMGDADDLATAGASGRLFLLDYDALLGIVPAAQTTPQKAIAAPLALFAVPAGGGSLRAIAIQCGQDPDRAPVISPPAQGTRSWAWESAKSVVQVAEGNYHELFVHLGRTHLLIEAFILATHRHLAERHPLNALLLPHFEGTLFINNSAAGGLIAAGGPIDKIFAGVITTTELAAANDRLQMDFYAAMPPTDFQTRGVDDTAVLSDYPYRDDARLIWSAIHDWVSAYVGVYYPDDQAVMGDTELAAWAAALTSEGRVKGFRPISTRAQLSDVVSMIIFTASAQHAAVNYPQSALMSYAPAISGASWAPTAITPDAAMTEAAWLQLMPPIPQAQEQLSVLHLLGSVYYRPLGDYQSNSFPYEDWLRDPAITADGGPLAQFRERLQAIEAEITTRNQRRPAPYPYLLPSRIPVSINI
ncbi:MAG: lipoxygenase family protein [Myxococcota bacterium]